VWASEQQLDEAAVQMGIDPIELRMRNFLRPRERLFPGGRGLDADMRANVEMLTDGVDLDRVGIAVAASDAGYLPMSVAEVKVHADGSVTLSTGAAEMGQGSATVLSQIVAGELGVPLESVAVVQSDTSASPFEASTGASRTTTLAGRAVLAACDDATRQLLRCARAAYGGLPASRATIVRGGVSIDLDETKTWGEIVRAWFGGPGGEIVGRGYVRRAGEFQVLPPFWEIGCVAAEVEVDEETGVYDVTKLTIVGDVGLAINPRLAAAQDVGGAVMGLGLATREELIYLDGDLVNLGVVDYRVPRARDVHQIVTHQAERRDGIGPYGSKGSGEGALNPTPAAIANAIARRYDVRLREAPITPERLWRALRDRRLPAAGEVEATSTQLDVPRGG
jgi:CO/xanthine dehydrogenase Mo-binding subunit